MSSKRTILSRPRTRVYDSNYNMGESMYRPALDRLNRKYSGRPLSPPRASSIPKDLLERHERAFFDDSLENSRRRAEKTITGETLFDSRGARLDPRELLDSFDDETMSRIKSIRASKKVATTDDIDMESTVNNLTGRRFLDRTDKILDSVGIHTEPVVIPRRNLEEDITIKRRSVRINQEEDTGVRSRELSKWTAIKDEAIESLESAALARAKQSRARLNDLDDEMEALEARAHEREKRNARLKALIAEVTEETDVTPPVSSRRAIRFREQRQEEL